jgi:hypothetical protein
MLVLKFLIKYEFSMVSRGIILLPYFAKIDSIDQMLTKGPNMQTEGCDLMKPRSAFSNSKKKKKSVLNPYPANVENRVSS